MRFADADRRADPGGRRARRSWRSSSPSSPTSPGAPRRSASARACASACRSRTWRSSRPRALKRAVRLGEPRRRRRASRDLGAVVASTVGKIELEIGRRRGARGADRRAAHHQGAVRDVRPARDLDDLDPVVEAFEDGLRRRDRRPDAVARVRAWVREVPGPGRRRRRPGHVRRHRRGRGAGGRRLGRRVPARGPPPRPAAQQGPRRRRRRSTADERS